MEEYKSLVEAIFTGWRDHAALLIHALEPLTPEQLALRPALNLRSIEAIATHIIGARARWFSPPLGDGDKLLARYGRWDRRGGPVREVGEIVQGLSYTFDFIQNAIARWTPQAWQETMPGEEHEPEVLTRQWVIWHLIEHDIHHTGEISLALGMNKLKAPDL